MKRVRSKAKPPMLPGGPALRNRQPSHTAAIGIAAALAASFVAEAGDILRGGAPAAATQGHAGFGRNEGPTLQARANARDTLARTTKAVQSVKAMQRTARELAIKGANNLGPNPNTLGKSPLPNVVNGLTPGGLAVSKGVPKNLSAPALGENASLWRGAELPTQSTANGKTKVVVKQTASQAVLSWETFNVGKNTTLSFDQSQGGDAVGRWVAFNMVSDPSGAPSQILGSIEAPGQVYVINSNGIIFGGSSQVNAHALVASSLPINDNLISLGLLNNRDAQFLFSTLTVPGGSDGTPDFVPAVPLTPSKRAGDVVVKAGATITSPVNAAGSGGRVMLVGANVENSGQIETPSGQTILAAGQQVGVAAHASNDPSLRGLDVWIGEVAPDSGTVTNRGLIDAPTGSISMSGKSVNQFGTLQSTTSVNLNGRIDLRASYGAVSNPNFNATNTAPFALQKTGVVTFGEGSVTTILPDYTSNRTVPGTSLPEVSQINIEGLAIHFDRQSLTLAPSGDIRVRAGNWAYKNPNADRTTLGTDGFDEPGLTSHFSNGEQRFLLSGGQIYLDRSSMISVAGSTDVSVPLAHSILDVEFRGSELADSPLQRDGVLRATPLTVDIRRTGSYDGRFWMGTALGDVTGLAGLIQRNAAQLTANGGNVMVQSGRSIIIRDGATIDVSGGFFQNEGGLVKTSRLLQNGRLIDIADAVPDQTYDGVYTGQFTTSSPRWGFSSTFTVPWMTGERFEAGYVSGASGGTLTLSAPAMALDGKLLGVTVEGPRQRTELPTRSQLTLTFEAERATSLSAPNLQVIRFSPTPPTLAIRPNAVLSQPGDFTLKNGAPVSLSANRTKYVGLSPDLFTEHGFGSISISNPDGNIIVPEGVNIATPVKGGLSLTGGNVTIRGNISAPGGKLAFRAFNLSPSYVEEFNIFQTTLQADPQPDGRRGNFTLTPTASLSTAGLVVDDRVNSTTPFGKPMVVDAGEISISAFFANLGAGSIVDVSGGAAINPRGRATYGNAGTVDITTGRDLSLSSVTGGTLTLGSTLRGYSGATGGTLSLQAMLIQVGGESRFSDAMLLPTDFFQEGGFTKYSLTGIGRLLGKPSASLSPQRYAPAVYVAPNSIIEPKATSLIAVTQSRGGEDAVLKPFEKEEGQRAPVSVSLNAIGSDDDFTIDLLEARGDVVIGPGSRLTTDPGATVSIGGNTVTVHGAITAPGGTVTIKGRESFALSRTENDTTPYALPTVHIGKQAVLSTEGATTLVPDAFGRRLGSVSDGGMITVFGNIVAEAGSVLNVSGARHAFDVHPSQLGLATSPLVPPRSGVTAPLWRLDSIPTDTDSDGGLIEMEGSQMLLSDATLLGKAGGPNAKGGTLAIHSGRFYPRSGGTFTGLVRSTDINLIVKQTGNVVPTARRLGIGRRVFDEAGTPVPGLGYFTLDRFADGGFDSLDLGAKFLRNSLTSPLAYGGNLQFRGAIDLQVPGMLRLAGGGVLRADSTVRFHAPYIAVGQPFQNPLRPEDRVTVFQQLPVGSGVQDLPFAPTSGSGALELNATLLDVGNLSLQRISTAHLTATSDIRGNGTIAIRGDLSLQAAQIYPTSLATFNLFAYDPANRSGSIAIVGGGPSETPISAGGSLNVFATTITQSGTLRAPMGSINLGWDGSDFDRADADVDVPRDPITLGALAAPTANSVSLQAGSLTSVSAVSQTTGQGMLLPFGVSPDGFSWIDPRGVNITTGGVPAKRIAISGTNVSTASGSTIDIRGGGELYAYRWVPGNVGSTDLLGTPKTEWAPGTEYQAGDLVSFRGVTYTARTGNTGQRPAVNIYWSRVADSFAVIPDFTPAFAPINAFNSATADLLQGDPGYIFKPAFSADRVSLSLGNNTRTNQSLSVGDQIFIRGVEGLPEGNYTLLPRGYARLPGAFLVTPQSGDPLGTFTLPTTASLTQGYRFNSFSKSGEPVSFSRFEIAAPEFIAQRASYEDYLANSFFAEAANRFEISRPQRLPADAGYLGIHGNVGLDLNGGVLGMAASAARGAQIDVSSLADIFLVGGTGTAPQGSTAVLKTSVLESWGADSLVIGGLRRATNDGFTVDVRTSGITVSNSGDRFSAPEIVLASKEQITLSEGARLSAQGSLRGGDELLRVSGDGALIRLSTDPSARLLRTNVTAATTPLLTIGAGAEVSGVNVTLDSSYGSRFDSTAQISATSLDLGSGQISVVLGHSPAALSGSVVTDHLVLAGDLFRDVQQVNNLTLRSYRTIDLYGTGTFGSDQLDSLTISAAGIRGYDQGTGAAQLNARNVVIGNPSNVSALAAPMSASGELRIDADTVRLGSNAFATAGYERVGIDASGGFLGTGSGSFATGGKLTINTPQISGERGSTQVITAGAEILLDRSAGAPTVTGDLGASFTFTGSIIRANTDILLPSGEIVLHALIGDVTIGGTLSVAGSQRRFYDLTRYSDAGRILLTSELGNIRLLQAGQLSVASAGSGRAGSLSINAAKGTFANAGTGNLLGGALRDEDSGTFQLDVNSIGTYASLNRPLQAGGFFNERNIRVRTGSVTIDGTTRSQDFTLSADQGSITVTGTLNAAGRTGGNIVLVAGDSITLATGSRLNVHATEFNSAGKGGSIRLEAGAAIDGIANEQALLDIQQGATIDLGVDRYVAGPYTNPLSSAFHGQFQGTLHLRAPRVGDDIAIGAIAGSISGASSIVVEGFRVYDRTFEGTLDNFLRDQIHADAQSYMSAGYDAMLAKLTGGSDSLNSVLVLTPGIEIISRTGDLVLGTDLDDYTNDWDLSSFRYGPRQAPGVLTIRAAGNVEFKNALSDGFRGDFSPNDFGEVPRPGQELWLRPLADLVSTLPINTQSWSYRLTAGSDFTAADFRRLRPLDTLEDGHGSLLVGKFYPADLFSVSGLFAGPDATTASVIENRFQVVRTGTGDIDIHAARDIQLRNQFATIYTAGVRLPYNNTVVSENEPRTMSIFGENDFTAPLVEQSTSHPSQGQILGQFQQAYPAQYGMAGGDLTLFAQQDIGRFTQYNGTIRPDSSRQLPNNWLYRRGFVDPTTGAFGAGGIGLSSDLAGSTTWWVDFSNFFEGFGALSGGNISMAAGRDIINADAFAPTNARMPGRVGATGALLTPDASRLVELGGGDISVQAGNDISGGVYYVERGKGRLQAGGSITTNSSRSPSLGILGSSFSNLDIVQSGSPSIFDPLTWLPTTLFVGKSHFDITAAGNVLLGPVTNPFMLPQGVNNKFWYKTYFNTYSDDAGITVSSFGGSVTHRMAVTLPGNTGATPVLQAWLSGQNVLTAENASFYEPWIRLSEGNIGNFNTITTITAPSLRSTAFAGNINLVGDMNLFPSPTGTLELAASQGIIGLQPTGRTYAQVGDARVPVTAWTTASINLSDADPRNLPAVASPLAYRALVGNFENALRDNLVNPFANIAPAFLETGSYSGLAASAEVQGALHASGVLHSGDTSPVRLYALGSDITALLLFTPKATQIAAANDITDIAFYLQNTDASSISFVSAGRDIVAFNQNSSLRSLASDLTQGNLIVTPAIGKNRLNVLGTTNTSLEGDIQISGPGALEVLAGGDLDLGTGANLADGTGTGLTSIGNSRNPFLPFAGADLIVMAGVAGSTPPSAALGLAFSSLDFEGFIAEQKLSTAKFESAYLERIKFNGEFNALTEQQQAIVALEAFYRELRDAGRDSAKTNTYDPGFAAIDSLFGSSPRAGEIFTRTRDIRTTSGGAISISAPGGGLTMASDIFGNPLTPPGIVTEFGGALSVFTDTSVDIGQARIFTLRGGDIMMWSSTGDIAAGSAPKTVVTAPPTRVVIDSNSADVQTDLGGLATGGGIGVLASVEGIDAGNVDLIAPGGVVDAGDAGIRATGNLNIAATAVLNASNIKVSGSSAGVPAAPTVAAPNIAGLTGASSATAATSSSSQELTKKQTEQPPVEEPPSIISVEVLSAEGNEEI